MAKTYYRVVKQNNVVGLETKVFFSDGTVEVKRDFMKTGKRKAEQLQKGGK